MSLYIDSRGTGFGLALALGLLAAAGAAAPATIPSGPMTVPEDCWTQVAELPADPLGRELEPGRGAFLCFDPGSALLLRYGGYTPTECNALWTFDLSARRWDNPLKADYSWPPPADRPGAGAWWSLAWDGKRRVIWMCGGSGLVARRRPELVNDIWRYDPATHTFTAMRAKGFPAFSGGCRIVYDAKHDRVIRAPAYDGEWSAMCNRDRTWVYDPNQNAWEGRDTPGAPKSALAAVWVYDEAAGKAVYLAQGKDHTGETWTYDAALAGSQAWVRVETRERPPARVVAGAAYDPENRQVVICGGVGHPGSGYGYLFRGGGVQLTDTWALNLARGEWTKLNVGAPVVPALNGQKGARFEHFCALAYDAKNKALVLAAPTMGVWVLRRGAGQGAKPAALQLAPLPTAAPVAPVFGQPVFTMAPPNPKLVGLASNEWVQLDGGTAIGGGEVPLIYDEATGFCLKYGGCNNGGAGSFASGYGNDLSAYDPATERWMALRWVDPCGPPRPANGCTRSYAHDPVRKMNWFAGGTAGNGLAFSLPADFTGVLERATWRYDGMRDRFELTSTSGRTPHGWDRVVCCFDRTNELFVFNGQLFDPKAAAWSDGGPGLPVMYYTYACYVDSLKGMIAIKQEQKGDNEWVYKTRLYSAASREWNDLPGGDGLPATKTRRNPMTAYDPGSDTVICVLDGKTFAYDVKGGNWHALAVKTPDVAEQMTYDSRHRVVLATGAMGRHMWAFRYDPGTATHTNDGKAISR